MNTPKKHILQPRSKSVSKPIIIPKRPHQSTITPFKPNEPKQGLIIRPAVNPPISRPTKTIVKPVAARVLRPRKSIEYRSSAVKRTKNAQNDEAINRLRDIGKGRVLVILACGPSILEVPIERLKNQQKIDIMCINKPEARVWPSKYWAFCDQSQYARNKEAWEKYTGLIINSTSVRARRTNQVLISNISGKGFSKDLIKGYYIGRSSTYAAIQVALWMGYKSIYVLGLDMCAVGGKLHFYGQNPDVTNDNRMKRFDKEAESYQHAAQTLSNEERQRIILCSSYNQYQFVKQFANIHQKDAIDRILQDAGV